MSGRSRQRAWGVVIGAALLSSPARSQPGTAAVLVARGPGVPAATTQGLALKLAVLAQRRGLSQAATPVNTASGLPPEDDPFYPTCFSDDDCLLRLGASAGQALLLVIVEGPSDHRRARLAFIQEPLRLLVRRGRDLPAPFARSVEQEAMATLEAGIARLPAVASTGAPLPASEAGHRQTLRLWKLKCAVCHGLDGKGHTVMGLRLALADMADPAWQKKVDGEKVKGWLIEGGHADPGSDHEMASLRKLTGEQVDALLAHVRSFGNQGGG